MPQASLTAKGGKVNALWYGSLIACLSLAMWGGMLNTGTGPRASVMGDPDSSLRSAPERSAHAVIHTATGSRLRDMLDAAALPVTGPISSEDDAMLMLAEYLMLHETRHDVGRLRLAEAARLCAK